MTPDHHHDLLLRLAGKVPDPLLARSRPWLAAGDLDTLGPAVAHAAAVSGHRLSGADTALLSDWYGSDEDASPGLPGDDWDSYAELPYDFLPVLPGSSVVDILAPTAPPAQLDLTLPGAPPPSAVDTAAMAALAAEPGALALWRAWRLPAPAAAWPPPRAVYLAELADGSDRPAVAARLHAALAAAGEPDPQVEVFRPSDDLPRYHRLACLGGALLWAAEPAPAAPVRWAKVFDDLGPDVAPGFSADHPVEADPAVRTRLLAYLAAGEPIAGSPVLLDDVVDPELDPVPIDLRTDGHWVWSEASAHYLDRHGLLPDPDLVAHIETAPPAKPPVSRTQLFRVAAALSHKP